MTNGKIDIPMMNTMPRVKYNSHFLYTYLKVFQKLYQLKITFGYQ